MAELIKCEILELPDDICIVGKELKNCMVDIQQGNCKIPQLWASCLEDGTLDILEAQSDYVYDKTPVGVMTYWDRNDNDYDYIVGLLMKSGAKIPDGYVSYALKNTTVAIGHIKGKNDNDCVGDAHVQTDEALTKLGYRFIPRWNLEKYDDPDENGDVMLYFYLPCEKQA